MLNKFLKTSILAAGIAVITPSCATISESECVAGNWADLGYRDGVDGRSRSRIADYVEKCGEYGAQVDRDRYLSNYETGLTHYCVYDKGYALGEQGNGFNSVCAGPQAANFRRGYDDGYGSYQLRREYDEFEENIEQAKSEILDITSRIADPNLDADEVKRLKKKKKRLRDELDDLKWDFRAFKREYDLD